MRETIDQLWRLLPSTSTDLERDLLAVTPFDGVLDLHVPKITKSKLSEIPDNWLPWLILEYGLGNLQEFLPDSRTLIEQGLLLRHERGTVAAIKRAMSWLGLTVTVIEEEKPGLHGYEYQLDIGEVPEDLTIICKIVKLARIVAPLRSRLRRILHGLDRPMLVWDDGKWDSDIWDNYSGVWSGDVPGMCSPPPNVWLSFGRRNGSTALAFKSVSAVSSRSSAGHNTYEVTIGDGGQITIEGDWDFSLGLSGGLRIDEPVTLA